MSSSAAVEVISLRKIYRDGLLRRRRVEALKGVSFRVDRGVIFGLLGPNGAGKTTVIKLLLGIVRPSAGTATLLGRRAGDRLSRRAVGYLPENHRIPRHHTGNTALEYYGSLSGMPGRAINRRRTELLQLVGLAQWGKTPVKKYSKGMLQRLGLAQALMHDPELLILDELTDGVDPIGRSEMRKVLQQLRSQGKTVFINSHLLQEVELLCDRVAILDKGELRREGLIEEFTKRQEAEIELTLVGTEAAIRSAFVESEVAGWTSVSFEQHRVTSKLVNQQAVDRCIDALRRNGVSIVEFARRRSTLEETFLDVVTKAAAPALVQQGHDARAE